MSQAVSAEPVVLQSTVPCVRLAELPCLPVVCGVLGSPSGGQEKNRRTGERLRQLADELGVAAGVEVVVVGLGLSSLPAFPAAEHPRVDIMVFQQGNLPPDPLASSAPFQTITEEVVELLKRLRTRVWLLEPPMEELEPREWNRRVELGRRITERGGPPGVLLPQQWSPDELDEFHEDFLQQCLHDLPLHQAVGASIGVFRPVPTLFLPAGKRHGLELGRLLEDHRQRLHSLGNGLKVLRAELRALSHLSSEPLGIAAGAWVEQIADLELRLTVLGVSCDEVNRDRDPAGWGRLAQDMEEMKRIETSRDELAEAIVAVRLQASAQRPSS